MAAVKGRSFVVCRRHVSASKFSLQIIIQAVNFAIRPNHTPLFAKVFLSIYLTCHTSVFHPQTRKIIHILEVIANFYDLRTTG